MSGSQNKRTNQLMLDFYHLRTLYYAPIVHPIEDYASLGPEIKKAFVAKIGEAAFEYVQRRIEEFWELVEKSKTS